MKNEINTVYNDTYKKITHIDNKSPVRSSTVVFRTR